MPTPTRAAAAPSRLFWDGFGRADSNTTLGTADNGRAWTVGNSTDAATLPTWGVTGGKGYLVATGSQNDPHAWVDVGTPDVVVTCTHTVATAATGVVTGILVRRVDASNYLAVRFTPSTGNLAVFRNLATVRTTTYSKTIATGLADNQVVRVVVVCRGTKITIKVDSVWYDTYTETNFLGATKFGLYQIGAATGAATFEDFLVERA
jgi:hypothetical protein